jgi:HEAT repeat protein
MTVFLTSLHIYLAALAGVDGPERVAAIDSLVASGDVEWISQAVYETGWRERDGLIDALERIVATSELVDIARNHPKVDAQRLAIRSLGRVGILARDALLALMHSPHRDLVVEGVGNVGDARDVAVVRTFLADAHPDVRRRAALALVALTGDEAVDDLALLLGDSHHGVRFVSAEALVALGDVSGQAVLTQYDALSVAGQFTALGVLGRLRYEPARVLVFEVLGHADWSLRSAAVEALVFLGDAKTVLKRMLDTEPHPFVRARLQEALLN